ncbi:MAG: ribokinase [Bacillota bacterium]|nr:ribokinase [Bacillota bacterium]
MKRTQGQPVRVLVVGSMNMDLVLTVERFPQPNETVFGTTTREVPGGKGGNQAVAACRLGAETRMVAAVGADANGRKLVAGLAAEGIATDSIAELETAATGLAVIPVDADGNNQIMVFPGANLALDVEQVRAAFTSGPTSAGPTADVVLLQLEISPAAIRETVRLAREQGILTVLDAGPAGAVEVADFAGIDVISPNESETLAWTGIDPVDDAACQAAAELLLQKSGARMAVLKLGRRGAWLQPLGAAGRRFPTFEAVRAVDSTAAGDAFTAALALRFVETGDWEEAVLFGNAAGSICVSRHGAQPSLPQREEVLSFLAEQGGITG